MLAAANDFYNHKMNKYKNYINQNNIQNSLVYVPVIFEDYGGCHKGTVQFIKKIARLRAANMNVKEEVSIPYCFAKISACLQHANIISLMNHYYIYSAQQHEYRY